MITTLVVFMIGLPIATYVAETTANKIHNKYNERKATAAR